MFLFVLQYYTFNNSATRLLVRSEREKRKEAEEGSEERLGQRYANAPPLLYNYRLLTTSVLMGLAIKLLQYFESGFFVSNFAIFNFFVISLSIHFSPFLN